MKLKIWSDSLWAISKLVVTSNVRKSSAKDVKKKFKNYTRKETVKKGIWFSDQSTYLEKKSPAINFLGPGLWMSYALRLPNVKNNC